MTLKEILKSQGLTDEQIESVIGEMKQNKIFTSNEENLDIRYGKLKTDHDTLTTQFNEAKELIDTLKKSNKGNDDLQSKVTDYESKVQTLQEELDKTKMESAIKVALLGAKADDVDYLAYKLKEKGELKLDDKGNIKGIEDMLTSLKTQFPMHFESSTQKKIDENKLPDNNDDKTVTKEQFDKMSYKEKLDLFNENEELYNELRKED